MSMLLLMASVAATLGKSTSAITPVQKVLQMMEDMKAKGITEKNEEIVTFKTLVQFCKDTNVAKGKAISDSADAMVQLKADMEKYASDEKVLGKEMSKLDKLIFQAEADKASSKQQYDMDEADYNKLHAQYEQNIVDMGVGINDLKAQKASLGASASSFIQRMASKPEVPEHARGALMAFLSTSSAVQLQRSEAPEASSYASNTGGVEDILFGLEDKLHEELAKLERDFLKTQGSFQMLQQTFTDQIDQHSISRNHKASTKKEKEEARATAEGDLADTESLKAEDEAYLMDVQSNCAQESSDYEKRQKDRAGEVRALNKAIEIISGGAVSGAAEKHLSSLVQGASLAQLRSNSASTSKASLQHDAQRDAASFLQQQSRRISSGVLAALSLRVAGDPFVKVKKMIQDMVFKLMTEANEEAEQKGFCDAELGKNKMTRDQKTTSIDELTATIDELSSKMVQLGTEISDLSQRISDTDAAIQEATAIRQDEKAKNTQTIEEAVGASVAVKQALDVLNEYYQSVGGSAVLLQSTSSTGILGMLEVILSDFARLESNTKSNEATSQGTYKKFIADSNLDRSMAEQQVKDKSESRTEADINLADAKKDWESTQAELSAAKAYFEKLKPTCAGEKVSYDDRVARRELEIESLKEALKILDEQPIA